jgi:hypothetical protein
MVQTKWLETLKLASNFKTAKDAEMLLGLVVQLSRIGLKRTSIGKVYDLNLMFLHSLLG